MVALPVVLGVRPLAGVLYVLDAEEPMLPSVN